VFIFDSVLSLLFDVDIVKHFICISFRHVYCQLVFYILDNIMENVLYNSGMIKTTTTTTTTTIIIIIIIIIIINLKSTNIIFHIQKQTQR